MITPILFKRNNVEYELYRGVENGQTTLYFQTVVPDEDNLNTRWYFVSMYVDTDRSKSFGGKVVSIRTEWSKVRVSIAGNVVANLGIETMITRTNEVELFCTIFGGDILSFMANGLVRDNWGFNHLPVIDTRPTIDGEPNPNFRQPMVYTNGEESTLPTGDYSTYSGGPVPALIPTPEPQV